MEIQKLSCNEYAKKLNSKFAFESFMDDMLRVEHFQAIVLFNFMKKQAELDSVYLVDSDTWDYEEYFDALYSLKESVEKN